MPHGLSKEIKAATPLLKAMEYETVRSMENTMKDSTTSLDFICDVFTSGYANIVSNLPQF